MSAHDRDVLLDWLAVKFGPTTKPFPRTYVPPEITTYFSDGEANALTARACTNCHAIDRVNDARYSPDRWRVVTVDMRERGAKLTDEELDSLLVWETDDPAAEERWDRIDEAILGVFPKPGPAT